MAISTAKTMAPKDFSYSKLFKIYTFYGQLSIYLVDRKKYLQKIDFREIIYIYSVY